MRLFVKVYADDLKSASSTYPVVLKGGPETTLSQLKSEIETTIKPTIASKNQILSVKKGLVIVSRRKVLNKIDEDRLRRSEHS